MFFTEVVFSGEIFYFLAMTMIIWWSFINFFKSILYHDFFILAKTQILLCRSKNNFFPSIKCPNFFLGNFFSARQCLPNLPLLVGTIYTIQIINKLQIYWPSNAFGIQSMFPKRKTRNANAPAMLFTLTSTKFT